MKVQLVLRLRSADRFKKSVSQSMHTWFKNYLRRQFAKTGQIEPNHVSLRGFKETLRAELATKRPSKADGVAGGTWKLSCGLEARDAWKVICRQAEAQDIDLLRLKALPRPKREPVPVCQSGLPAPLVAYSQTPKPRAPQGMPALVFDPVTGLNRDDLTRRLAKAVRQGTRYAVHCFIAELTGQWRRLHNQQVEAKKLAVAVIDIRYMLALAHRAQAWLAWPTQAELDLAAKAARLRARKAWEARQNPARTAYVHLWHALLNARESQPVQLGAHREWWQKAVCSADYQRYLERHLMPDQVTAVLLELKVKRLPPKPVPPARVGLLVRWQRALENMATRGFALLATYKDRLLKRFRPRAVPQLSPIVGNDRVLTAEEVAAFFIPPEQRMPLPLAPKMEGYGRKTRGPAQTMPKSDKDRGSREVADKPLSAKQINGNQRITSGGSARDLMDEIYGKASPPTPRNVPATADRVGKAGDIVPWQAHNPDDVDTPLVIPPAHVVAAKPLHRHNKNMRPHENRAPARSH